MLLPLFLSLSLLPPRRTARVRRARARAAWKGSPQAHTKAGRQVCQWSLRPVQASVQVQVQGVAKRTSGGATSPGPNSPGPGLVPFLLPTPQRRLRLSLPLPPCPLLQQRPRAEISCLHESCGVPQLLLAPAPVPCPLNLEPPWGWRVMTPLLPPLGLVVRVATVRVAPVCMLASQATVPEWQRRGPGPRSSWTRRWRRLRSGGGTSPPATRSG